MSRICKLCGLQASKKESYEAYGTEYKKWGGKGRCLKCRECFCDNHLDVESGPDEIGGMYQRIMCYSCTAILEDEWNKYRLARIEKIPIVGWLAAWCLKRAWF